MSEKKISIANVKIYKEYKLLLEEVISKSTDEKFKNKCEKLLDNLEERFDRLKRTNLKNNTWNLNINYELNIVKLAVNNYGN